uniref:Secreted protein n=1 Tax=Steinernema glaseri TaxID=37863 RepID=A0A1I8AQS1_9BILA
MKPSPTSAVISNYGILAMHLCITICKEQPAAFNTGSTSSEGTIHFSMKLPKQITGFKRKLFSVLRTFPQVFNSWMTASKKRDGL